MPRRLMVVLSIVILAVAVASELQAGKPDKGKKKARKADASWMGFSSVERESVRVYFVNSHGRGNCPPGLAKKNNGCLPPGLAKKRFVVGEPLPPRVEVVEVPEELRIRIGPPPAGYRYGLIDGDLVKLVVGTELVVDAIEGLVH